MPDWALIAVRWALYLDLGLLFGVLLFGAYALTPAERALALPLRWPGFILAVGGLFLSAIALLVLTANMLGVSPMEVDQATLSMLVLETMVGWAWLARCGALAVLSLLAIFSRSDGAVLRWTMLPLAGIAVVSLAWTGHGAAGEWPLGLVQLLGDMVHLLAASAWIGALASFLLLLRRALQPDVFPIAHRALASFSGIGTAIVALLILTGLINGCALVGLDAIFDFGSSGYGQLLILKLGIFGLMLMLAARHRWHFVPKLDDANAHKMRASLIVRLHFSLWVESVMALAILAAVAWMGALPPSA